MPKILHSSKEGDTYTVTKAFKKGVFTEKVKVHPEDKDVQSDILGYEFAEHKCDIDEMRLTAEQLYQRYLQTCHLYYVALDKYEGEHETIDEFINFFERQVAVAKSNYEKALNRYKTRKNNYKDFTTFTLAQQRELKNRK